MFLDRLIPSLAAWRDRRNAMRELQTMQKREAMQLDGDDANPLHLAVVALRTDDKRSALGYWRQAVARYPAYVLASPDALDVMLGLDLLDEAETAMVLGRKRFPRRVHYAIGYARVAERRRDWAAALTRWAAVRRKFPNHPAGYINGAAILRDRNDLPEAEALVARAVRLFPKDLHCALEAARVAEQRADWPLALTRWDRVAVHFNHPAGISGAARVQINLGRVRNAEMLVAEGLSRYAGDLALQIMWARLAEQRNDTAAALERWSDARRRFPKHPAAYIAGARLLADQQDHTALAAVIAQAREALPADLPTHGQLAALMKNRPDGQAAAAAAPDSSRPAGPSEASATATDPGRAPPP